MSLARDISKLGFPNRANISRKFPFRILIFSVTRPSGSHEMVTIRQNGRRHKSRRAMKFYGESCLGYFCFHRHPIIPGESFLLYGNSRRIGCSVNTHLTSENNNKAILPQLSFVHLFVHLSIFFAALNCLHGDDMHNIGITRRFSNEGNGSPSNTSSCCRCKSHQSSRRTSETRTGRPVARVSDSQQSDERSTSSQIAKHVRSAGHSRCH